METSWIKRDDLSAARAADDDSEGMAVANYLSAAADGDAGAYYELGVAFSTGSLGVNCDLVEAHKWFNLAAVGGHEEAQHCRAEISDEMTARQIAEAQRRARQWLSMTSAKVA